MLEARLLSTVRTEAGLGGPRPPGSTAVFSAPHLERRVGGRAPREGRIPIMGTSAMKTLRMELATLQEESQAM